MLTIKHRADYTLSLSIQNVFSTFCSLTPHMHEAVSVVIRRLPSVRRHVMTVQVQVYLTQSQGVDLPVI